MSVAKWADTYGIHHWRTLWSSYRKLAWVGFEPTTTEFRSEALTLQSLYILYSSRAVQILSPKVLKEGLWKDLASWEVHFKEI